jgi:hypothetical protein
VAFHWLATANQNEAFSRQTPQCPFMVGYLLENGYATNQDYVAAAQLYWQAAEFGWPYAVFRLALLIERGQGIAQDSETARVLYTRAAELGIAEAAYRLGLLSNAKAFDPESRQEAFNWFFRAATNGFSMAQTKVGLSFEQDWFNRGRDPIEALAWYQIAAAHGNRGARIKAENLERSLSATQRSDSDIRASRIRSCIIEPTPKAQPGEPLLPANVIEKKSELFRTTDPGNAHRPRTLAEARLAIAKTSSGVAAGGRDDLQNGAMKVYLQELQSAVRGLAIQRLADRAKKELSGGTPLPEEIEIILAYRLCSDGRVEDVEVVDTNLDDVSAATFTAAMESVLPGPRWTPRLRAELSEEYQDLLLAFGKQSVQRISQ